MPRLLHLAGLGVRVGVTGGVALLLHQQGVWGDSAQGEAAYKRLAALRLDDLLGADLAAQVPEVPIPQEVSSGASKAITSVSDCKQNFWSYWNGGVRLTFASLTSLPQLAAEGSHQAWVAVQEAVK